MKGSVFILASMAIFGAIASPNPSAVGVEVLEQDGEVLVREVPQTLAKRACTNCVHVGGKCKIGEGNCYSTEHALCTYCGKKKGSICVDQDGGSCKAP